MRFSNDGTTFSPFRFYVATLPWTLTAGDGTKTVYAQYRDADGNLSPVVPTQSCSTRRGRRLASSARSQV